MANVDIETSIESDRPLKSRQAHTHKCSLNSSRPPAVPPPYDTLTPEQQRVRRDSLKAKLRGISEECGERRREEIYGSNSKRHGCRSDGYDVNKRNTGAGSRPNSKVNAYGPSSTSSASSFSSLREEHGSGPITSPFSNGNNDNSRSSSSNSPTP
ncbi:hypothetical protein IAT40_003865 [Kwoniella sp. CBS 6097]